MTGTRSIIDYCLSTSPLAKVLRVILVFMLVFFTTLHVEYVAFGEEGEGTPAAEGDGGESGGDTGGGESGGDTGGDTGGGESGGESGGDTGGGESGGGESGGGESGGGESGGGESGGGESGGGESGGGEAPAPVENVVSNVKVYEYAETAADHKGAFVGKAFDYETDNDGEASVPVIQDKGGSKRFIADIVTIDAAGKETLTRAEDADIEWIVTSENLTPEQIAELVQVDINKGSLTLTAKANNALDGGGLKVTAKLKEKYNGKINPGVDAWPEASFSVSITGQRNPYISNVVILDGKGNQIATDSATRTFEIDPKENSYTFQASVVVTTNATEGTIQEYKCTPEQGLEAQTDGAFEDLVWGVSDESAAKISKGQLEIIDKSKPFSVTCRAAGEGEQPGDEVAIVTSETAETQPYVEKIEILNADESSIQDKKVTIQAKNNQGEGAEGGEQTAQEGAATQEGATQEGAEGQGDGTQTPQAINETQTFLVRVTMVYPGSASTEAGTEAGAEAGTQTQTQDITRTFTKTAEGQWNIEPTPEGAEQLEPPTISWEVEPSTAASITTDGVLTMTAAESVTVTCRSVQGKDSGVVEDSVTVTVEGAEPIDDKPGALPGREGAIPVAISYTPAPYGKQAILSSYPYDVHGITYYTIWYESPDGGATWNEVVEEVTQTLKRPTVEPYIGRWYRAKVVTVNDPENRTGWSEAVELRVGEDGMYVRLAMTSVKEGEPTLFAAEVEGVDSLAGLRYTWEESEDQNNWTTIANGSSPTLEVPTTPDRMGHFFRVRVTAPDGESKLSNIEMLAALVSDGTVPTDPTDPTDPGNTNPGDGSDDSEGSDSSDPVEPSDDPIPELDPYYPDPTLEEPVDSYEEPVPTDYDTEPAEVEQPTVPDPVHSAQAFDNVVAAEDAATAEQAAKSSDDIVVDTSAATVKDGATWSPIYMKEKPKEPEPTLPEVPFAAPLFLGAAAAGAVEKHVRYRGEKRDSVAPF